MLNLFVGRGEKIINCKYRKRFPMIFIAFQRNNTRKHFPYITHISHNTTTIMNGSRCVGCIISVLIRTRTIARSFFISFREFKKIFKKKKPNIHVLYCIYTICLFNIMFFFLHPVYIQYFGKNLSNPEVYIFLFSFVIILFPHK